MRCTSCDKIITNPICPGCLQRGIRELLKEEDEYEGIAQLSEGLNCISCSKSFHVCPHCFCKEKYHEINEKDPDSAREFAARFDFDLRKCVFS